MVKYQKITFCIKSIDTMQVLYVIIWLTILKHYEGVADHEKKNGKWYFSGVLSGNRTKKSIDKITVKDITENCGYSSATFYRHFKDKYDLIA